MKKRVLVIALLFGGSVWAEWSNIGENDVDTVYVDLQSMHSQGNIRKILELQDLKQRGKNGEMSVLTKSEYDCEKGTYRVMAVTTYAGPMAAGKKISSKTINSKVWISVESAADDETVFDTVCAQ
jgi:hypothetical protein